MYCLLCLLYPPPMSWNRLRHGHEGMHNPATGSSRSLRRRADDLPNLGTELSLTRSGIRESTPSTCAQSAVVAGPISHQQSLPRAPSGLTMSCLARCQDRCQGRGHWRHWTRDRPSYMLPSFTLMPRPPPEPGPNPGPKRAPVAKSDWRPPLPAAQGRYRCRNTTLEPCECWKMVGSMEIQCGLNAK